MGFSIGGSWEHACDVWKTTPPEEPESNFTCEKCGEPFYPEDKFYDCEGYIFCRNCAEEWLEDLSGVATEGMCYGERY